MIPVFDEHYLQQKTFTNRDVNRKICDPLEMAPSAILFKIIYTFILFIYGGIILWATIEIGLSREMGILIILAFFGLVSRQLCNVG